MACRRLFRLPVSIALVGLAACTAVAGLDGEFEIAATGVDGGVDASSGGADATLGTDGSPATDAAQNDATADAPVDAGPEIDPVAPASFTADGGTLNTCDVVYLENRYFCWSFFGNESGDLLGNNWSYREKAHGNFVVAPDAGTRDRAMQLTMDAPGPAYDGGAGLWLQVYEKDYVSGDTLDYSFSFKVSALTTFATLGVIESRGVRYGLVVHPSGCNGRPCLSDTSAAPKKLTAFDLGAWYRARIHLEREGSLWSGKVFVDTKTISETASVFEYGDLDVVRIGVGALDPRSAGATKVEIDDIYLAGTPVPEAGP